MKCPKCNYLGFETGDRCRNCGYDFSLISHGDPQPVDMDLELRSAQSEAAPAADWPIRAEARLYDRLSTIPVSIAYERRTKSQAWRTDWPAFAPHEHSAVPLGTEEVP